MISLLERLNQTAVSPYLKRNCSPQLITGFNSMYFSLIWSLNPTQFALSYWDFAPICCFCLSPTNSSSQQNSSFSVFTERTKADILTANQYVYFNIDAYNGTAIHVFGFFCLIVLRQNLRQEQGKKGHINQRGTTVELWCMTVFTCFNSECKIETLEKFVMLKVWFMFYPCSSSSRDNCTVLIQSEGSSGQEQYFSYRSVVKLTI